MTVKESKDKSLLKMGQNIRTLRRNSGLTQETLGFKTGLHLTYIGGIERGERNVSAKNLFQIARALDVTPATLLEGIVVDAVSQQSGQPLL